jgi:hypothetical protein
MDHPDEVLIRRRFLLWDRHATVPFEQVANVDPDGERVYLALPGDAIEWERGRA